MILRKDISSFYPNMIKTPLLSKSKFTQSVFVILTGSSLAQILTLLIAPILTRIYTPTQFGVLATYAALVSIVGPIASMRLELAIVQAKEESEAKNLTVLSFVISLLISFVLMVIFWALKDRHLVIDLQLHGVIILLPVSILLFGVYNAVYYTNVRNECFKINSRAKIVLGGCTGLVQVVVGILKLEIGLIIGAILGYVSAIAYLIKSKDLEGYSLVELKSIFTTFEKYKKFASLSVLGALADSVSLQLPTLLINKYYGAEIIGYYSLAFRTINLPAIILAASISQVLYKKIADLINTAPDRILKFISKVLYRMSIIAVVVNSIIFLFGESLFANIFGNEWICSGKMSSIICVAIAIRMIVSPLSAVMLFGKNIQIGLLWQVMYLCTISSTLIYASSHDIYVFLKYFVIHEIVMYSVYLLLIRRGCRNLVVLVSKKS